MKGALHKIYRVAFNACETLGVHLTPVHYYSPLPDSKELRRKRELFEREHPLHGIDMRPSAQLSLLSEVVRPFEAEYRELGGDDFGIDSATMPSYAPINALSLYGLVRHYCPSRIIEIGSGMSTKVMGAALDQNHQVDAAGELTVVDPFSKFDSLPCEHTDGELVRKNVEDLPEETFLSLDRNDILFIDSSHTVKIFGDVNYLFLTILPQLRPGVLVHVHDVFFPRDYLPHHFFSKGPRQVWQEQYLLQAFLVHNREFEVMCSMSYLHFKYVDELVRMFPWYHRSRCPSSFWMRRV